ncbi:hypothetical protein [Clostridium sp. OM02-18AC]|uniref:hypothetical protein n=1 Tax=Clostridium sp. OM02-18AC TaxID=2292311 RepID=UPI0015FCF25A|nr:hypothetical protein [Clostridium sp. OM02-18AC]
MEDKTKETNINQCRAGVSREDRCKTEYVMAKQSRKELDKAKQKRAKTIEGG